MSRRVCSRPRWERNCPSSPRARSRTKTEPLMNPLLAPWPGPYGGVPPWDQMRPEHFPAAFESALAEDRKQIEAIAAQNDAPTFDNTFAAMEQAGETLD